MPIAIMSKPLRAPAVPSVRILVFVFLGLLHLGWLTGCAGTPDPEKSIKLLTIGNSFTANALTYVPEFAAKDGKPLIIFPAHIGGASLETHAKAVSLYTENPANPDAQIYRTFGGNYSVKRHSLAEILTTQKWDYITIQESTSRARQTDFSTESLRILVEFIRIHAPQAKIFLFEPWSSRENRSPMPDGSPTSSQLAYNRIHTESLRLAAKFNLTLLPIGTAFQNARNTPLWQITTKDPDFDYENPPEGKLPDQTGSLIVGWSWGRTGNAPLRMQLDTIHANSAGSYLGGAVIYEAISGTDIRNLPLNVKDVSSSRAENLRELAHAALVESQPPAPSAPAAGSPPPPAATSQ